MSLWFRNLTVMFVVAAVSLAATPAFPSEDDLAEVRDLFDQQHYLEARRALEDLSGEIAEAGEALYYGGRLDLIDGDYDRAVKSLEHAVKAEPNRSDYHYWLGVAMMRKMPYRSSLGRMMSGMKMVKELRKAVELDPGNLMARMTLFQILARSYDMGGSQKQDLIEQVKAIAEIDSVMGHVARGTFYQLVERDLGSAGAEFETGFGLGPRNRAAVVSYADYLWASDRRDEAIAILTSFIEEVPEDKPARFNLGVKTVLLGRDYAAAERIFEDCLSLKSDTGMPSEPMVRWCLGLACHLRGKYDRAEEEWSAVYRIDKDFDDILKKTPDLAELDAILKTDSTD